MAPVRNPRASANVALPIAKAPVRSPWAFAVPVPSTTAKLSGLLVQPEPMLKKPPIDKVPPAFRTADQIRSVPERMKEIGEETPEIHTRVS